MPTSVQYNIRHLLALTLAVAVVMAVIGPVVRAWESQRRIALAVYAAVPLLLLAGYVCFLSIHRLRVEREAGEVVLRVRTSDSPHRRAGLAAVLLFCFVLMIAQWVVMSRVNPYPGREFLQNVGLLMWPIGVLPLLVVRLWWGLNFLRSKSVSKAWFWEQSDFFPIQS